MRIALDGSMLETDRPTGVERAQLELIRALGVNGGGHDYLLIARRPLDLGFPVPANFRVVDLGCARPGPFWRERLLAPCLARERVEVLHSPVLALPINGRGAGFATIATVHEVPWREPRVGARDLQIARRLRLAFAARRARWLIAVSDHTRGHVVALHPRAASRTVVVHHGVDSRFREAQRPDHAVRSLVPDAPFLLFVGAARARKNLAGLLAAYATVAPALREHHPLVLAGLDADAAMPWREQAQRLGLAPHVHFPGWIDEANLPDLYRAAHAFLFPSHFEGFGLPALEAMACGVPVVSSSGGALPEVVGDAALLVAPTEVTAWGAAITRIVSDATLRTQLRERGLARAAQFRWSRAASQVVALYEACR